MAKDYVRLFDYGKCLKVLAGDDNPQEKELRLVEECMSSEFLYLDYWGCYVEVFASGSLAGSIGLMALIPEAPEEPFLLLLPIHVELMTASLLAHRNELTMMTDESLAKLEEWRQLCVSDDRYRVAYCFG